MVKGGERDKQNRSPRHGPQTFPKRLTGKQTKWTKKTNPFRIFHQAVLCSFDNINSICVQSWPAGFLRVFLLSSCPDDGESFAYQVCVSVTAIDKAIPMNVIVKLLGRKLCWWAVWTTTGSLWAGKANTTVQQEAWTGRSLLPPLQRFLSMKWLKKTNNKQTITPPMQSIILSKRGNVIKNASNLSATEHFFMTLVKGCIPPVVVSRNFTNETTVSITLGKVRRHRTGESAHGPITLQLFSQKGKDNEERNIRLQIFVSVAFG